MNVLPAGDLPTMRFACVLLDYRVPGAMILAAARGIAAGRHLPRPGR